MVAQILHKAEILYTKRNFEELPSKASHSVYSHRHKTGEYELNTNSIAPRSLKRQTWRLLTGEIMPCTLGGPGTDTGEAASERAYVVCTRSDSFRNKRNWIEHQFFFQKNAICIAQLSFRDNETSRLTAQEGRFQPDGDKIALNLLITLSLWGWGSKQPKHVCKCERHANDEKHLWHMR